MNHAEPIACTHCGLPVPPGLVEAGAERQFCCNGCRTVYAVLHEHGLENFYRLVDTPSGRPQTAATTDRTYAEFDDPAFLETYGRRDADDSWTIDLYLEGVHCAACVWLVERVPVAVPGVLSARLDFGRQMATVVFDPENTRLSSIAGFLDSLGYPAHPYRGVHRERMRRKEDRAMLIRIGVAAASAGNVMLIAFALYGGFFGGMEKEFRVFFHWTSLVIALPALWAGSVFFKGAIGALRTRTLHMDLPISLGIGAGFAWGAFNTVRGEGEIYFDSVTVLIVLLLAGRFIQTRRQRSSADAAELLYSLSPSAARRVDGASVREVPLESLVAGDLVEVRAGDTVPADGFVEEGRSELDLSLLTGESVPRGIGIGDAVHAGTLNLNARLLVRVAATGEATRVGRLMRLVEEYCARKAPIVRLADRISGIFVAVVLALAGLTFALWLHAGVEAAIENAVALLIVTCPCALGLATPLAVSVAIGRAARERILIKGGDVLERLAHPGRLLLDKTGTMTTGRTTLIEKRGDDSVWPLVRALETHASHPVAQALVRALPDRGARAEDVRGVAGGGIVGRVDRRNVLVGSPAFARARGAHVPAWADDAEKEMADRGNTPVFVAVDGTVLGIAGFGDALRSDVGDAVARVRRMGWSVGVLSGDHPEIVRRVAHDLGIDASDAEGGVDPERKAEVVKAWSERVPVVMVGDGVNDAAALAAAGVGIAVHGGAEASLAAADVFVTAPGLAPIAHLLDGARRTVRVIKWNLAFSLAYNILGATLAMAGTINPLLAAILMPASSLTVITISLRAKTF
ncbi:MAG: heavy metal translocating P-type ATPase [Deltaproteobacteria bacterium]|nr:heavy metal translocating P-type ATPase [Deltaproteobacteria bacterium]